MINSILGRLEWHSFRQLLSVRTFVAGGFFKQVNCQTASCGDSGNTDSPGSIRVREQLHSLISAQVNPRQLVADDATHLGLEAMTELPRHGKIAERSIHCVGPPLLETDSHHGTYYGTADRPRIAYSSSEGAGYPWDDIIVCLYPQFLANCHEYGLCSRVPLFQYPRGPVMFHNASPKAE
jgi:hypothetical protein